MEKHANARYYSNVCTTGVALGNENTTESFATLSSINLRNHYGKAQTNASNHVPPRGCLVQLVRLES